jgi:hypothetical protein
MEFTRPELVTLLGLVWNAIKETQSPDTIDWTLVRLLAILVKACRGAAEQNTLRRES